MAARPAIRDPRAVPVVGRDVGLPAIADERLTLSALRQRLAHPPAWQPEFAGDGRVFDRPPAEAAVLVGLVQPRQAGDPVRVLLTQRTAHLRDHAGQVSFPGGRRDAADADLCATALREAQEEVGLDPARVTVQALLPTYTTVTHFVVTPVVALVDGPPSYQPHPGEVAAAFEVPLAYLMNPANHQRHRFEWDGHSREFLSMPWVDADGHERFIWGATAAMLRNVYRLLAA